MSQIHRATKATCLVAGCALLTYVLIQDRVRTLPGSASDPPKPQTPSDLSADRPAAPSDEELQRSEVVTESSPGEADLAPRPAKPAPSRSSEGSNQSGASLATEASEGPREQPEFAYPKSPQQREFVAASLFAPLTTELPAICYGDLRDRAIAKLPKGLSTADAARAAEIVERLAAAELGYRLELNQAIQDHVRSDAALDADPTPELLRKGKGHAGDATFGVADQALWGSARVVKVKYFLDYDKYPRLGTAKQALAEVKKELRELERNQGFQK